MIEREARISSSADLRTDVALRNPDSEQIEYTVAKPHIRNSVSVEQIQEKSRLPLIFLQKFLKQTRTSNKNSEAIPCETNQP